MTQISRRTVARGVAWSAPVLAVGGPAPAFAASCTPTTTNTTSQVAWTSTQTDFSYSSDGDPEYHTVEYTFTNNGTDPIPAASDVFQIHATITVWQGEEAALKVTSSDGGVTTTVSNTNSSNDDDGTTTDTAVVNVTTSAAIAVGGTFKVTVLATYGALSTAVDESVTVTSPVQSYDPTTCATVNAAITVSGASDGTSYTSVS